MKKGGIIVITESHPFINMLPTEDEELFDSAHPLECVYNYYQHVWVNNEGMSYITGQNYPSKTFTDYTHPLSEIINAMTNNKLLITGMQEMEYDVVGGFEHLNHKGIPLAMVLEGKKCGE